MINIQISMALEGESVSWLAGKLSPNFFFFYFWSGGGFGQSSKKTSRERCGKSEADVCVYKDKLN